MSAASPAPVDWALDAGTLREWAQGAKVGTGGQAALWARVEALRAEGRLRLWISPASLAAVSATAGPEAAALRHRISEEASRAGSPEAPDALRPFTADARSASEALADGWANWEAPMAHAGFRRLCPAGDFVTRDAEALFRLDGAKRPEQALADLEAASVGPAAAAASLPMLDLKEEYRLSLGALDRALLSAASSAQYILGPQVARFEGELAGYLGTKHGVGVSSGTEALVLALRALAWRRLGRERFRADEFILTTPFTFVATGDAILRAGATPLFCDIDPATGNLDAASVRRALEKPPGKIVGLVPVHLFGRPCDMDALLPLAKAHGLFVLEDVAQAFGAAWKGRRLGSLGDAAAFSFFPSKNLGGFGDAGGIATDDPELAAHMAMLLKHGGKGKGSFDVLGYNARLDTLQAAVLLEKLPRIEAMNRARRAVAKAYIDGLGDLAGRDGFALPEWPGEDPGSHVFHQFTLRCAKRDALQAHLQKAGVASMLYYPYPLHRMPLFQGRCAVGEASAGAGLPEAEKMASEVLSLPVGPAQGGAATAAVIASVRRFFEV